MLINCVDYISNLQCTEWKLYCKSVWHQLDSHKVPGKMEECIINQWLWRVNKLIHIHNEVHLSLTVYQNNNSATFPKKVITVTHFQFSNTTAQFLTTVVTKLHINDIQEALTQQLQSISSALRIGLSITVSYMERYGRCKLSWCNLYSHNYVINQPNFAWFCRWMWSSWWSS